MSKQPNLAVSSYMQAEEIEFCLWLEGILTGFFLLKKKTKSLPGNWEDIYLVKCLLCQVL